MTVKDMRKEPPRRWTVEAGGIKWLPRLIDKARAAMAGTLGGYLYGQSPMDRSLLHELGIGHRAFAEIVAAAPDDDAVVAALGARDPQSLERARAWSAELPTKHAAFLFVIDADDGYVDGPWHSLKPAINAASNALTWTIKRIWPARSIPR